MKFGVNMTQIQTTCYLDNGGKLCCLSGHQFLHLKICLIDPYEKQLNLSLKVLNQSSLHIEYSVNASFSIYYFPSNIQTTVERALLLLIFPIFSHQIPQSSPTSLLIYSLAPSQVICDTGIYNKKYVFSLYPFHGTELQKPQEFWK